MIRSRPGSVVAAARRRSAALRPGALPRGPAARAAGRTRRGGAGGRAALCRAVSAGMSHDLPHGHCRRRVARSADGTVTPGRQYGRTDRQPHRPCLGSCAGSRFAGWARSAPYRPLAHEYVRTRDRFPSRRFATSGHGGPVGPGLASASQPRRASWRQMTRRSAGVRLRRGPRHVVQAQQRRAQHRRRGHHPRPRPWARARRAAPGRRRPAAGGGRPAHCRRGGPGPPRRAGPRRVSATVAMRDHLVGQPVDQRAGDRVAGRRRWRTAPGSARGAAPGRSAPGAAPRSARTSSPGRSARAASRARAVGSPRPSSARAACHSASSASPQPPPQSPEIRPMAGKRAVRPSGRMPDAVDAGAADDGDAARLGRSRPAGSRRCRCATSMRARPSRGPCSGGRQLLLLDRAGRRWPGRRRHARRTATPGRRPAPRRTSAASASTAVSTPTAGGWKPPPRAVPSTVPSAADHGHVGLAVPRVDGEDGPRTRRRPGPRSCPREVLPVVRDQPCR